MTPRYRARRPGFACQLPAVLTVLICAATGLAAPPGATRAAVAEPAHALVLSVSATPGTLGAAGGKVTVAGTVRDATSCQLVLLSRQATPVIYSHHPTGSCGNGSFSARALVGPNHGHAETIIVFALVARDSTSVSTGKFYVVLRAPAVPAGNAGTWWQPGPLRSWQWQLTWPVSTSYQVQVYDIDYDGAGQGTPAQVAAVVAALHARGTRAVCYLETGGWEDYRPDAGRYPASVLGNSIDGYPDERYVDIRQWSVLGPILRARLQQCKSEGFDGVETDIDDSYTDNTGFPLTLAEEVTFDTQVASVIHALGMAWFLKNGINDDAFIADMAPLADGTVNEQCWQYDECDQLRPFVLAGKPILNAEYTGAATTVCPQALAFPMATMRKGTDLGASVTWACWSFNRPGLPGHSLP